MKRFELTRVECEKCGGVQDSKRRESKCGGCGSPRFRVEIDRSAWGLQSHDLEDFFPQRGFGGLLVDALSESFWSTHSLLTCAGVSGAEITSFRAASGDVRRKHYVGWKRRELEAALTKRRCICARCRGIYKIYRNEWNRSGFCSRACWSAADKGLKKRGK